MSEGMNLQNKYSGYVSKSSERERTNTPVWLGRMGFLDLRDHIHYRLTTNLPVCYANTSPVSRPHRQVNPTGLQNGFHRAVTSCQTMLSGNHESSLDIGTFFSYFLLRAKQYRGS